MAVRPDTAKKKDTHGHCEFRKNEKKKPSEENGLKWDVSSGRKILSRKKKILDIRKKRDTQQKQQKKTRKTLRLLADQTI